MEGFLFGILSALSLGSADFTARFTSRAFGVARALLVALLLECILISLWALGSGLVFSSNDLIPSLLLYGAASTLMTLLLFWGLARGPISVVAPIVAAHPALVVFYRMLFGQSLTLDMLLGIGLTIAGSFIVGLAAKHDHADRARLQAPAPLGPSIFIALAASVAYAVMVVSGQAAKLEIGALQTLWLGKLTSLAFLVLCVPLWLRAPNARSAAWKAWLALLAFQGALDAAGYYFLFLGTQGGEAPVVVVMSSTFGAVTVLLARLFIREEISYAQWLGILLITLGAGWLSWSASI